MNEAEIILNLWYVHDSQGFIYSLRIRPYVGLGSDDEKLATLQSLANVDYLIARVFAIPERFHIEVEENGRRQRLPVAPQAYLNGLDSPITLFEDAIKEIESDLPSQTDIRIPESPLFCSTALLADESGRLYSGRRIVRLCRGNEIVEVGEPTWALIVAFMSDQGWTPSVSSESFLSGNDCMIEEDALALAATGHDVFSNALGDPLAFQVRFDIGKLAEIIDLAAGGEFEICR